MACDEPGSVGSEIARSSMDFEWRKVLLEEWAEAGRVCRWYEQLSRIMITVFVIVQAAVLGIASEGFLDPKLVPLESLIVILGGIVAINLSRIRKYFDAYRTRAIEIERSIGIALYSSAEEFVRDNSIWSHRFANYWLMILVPTVFAVLNVMLIAFQLLRSVEWG
jgi:hypothetical protein